MLCSLVILRNNLLIHFRHSVLLVVAEKDRNFYFLFNRELIYSEIYWEVSTKMGLIVMS